MDRFFLKIKHWQLILLPFAVSLILIVLFNASPASNRPYALSFFLNPAAIYSVFVLFWYGWIYFLGINLHRKLPPTVKMNLRVFKNSIYLIFIWLLCLCIFIPLSYYRGPNSRDYFLILFSIIFLIMFLFSILAVILSFRCRYVVTRALRAAEKQETVKFQQFAIDFFLMILFLPFGILKVQPRVNRLFKEDLDSLQELKTQLLEKKFAKEGIDTAKKIQETKQVIKWILSIILLLLGLNFFITGFHIRNLLLSGIFLIIAGIILLPPLGRIIQNKVGITKRRWISYTTVIIMCLFSMNLSRIPYITDRESGKAKKIIYYSSNAQPLNNKETRLIKKAIHHENKNVCLKVVNKITDQNMLLNIVVLSRYIDVRRKALNRITNQDFLVEILKRKNTTEIHYEALNKMTDQICLTDVIKNCDNADIRIKALAKIQDQNTIFDIARNDPDTKVRTEAIRIIKDRNVIADIAKTDPDYEIRQFAYKKLGLENSQEALYDIFQNDPIGWVCNDAFDKLTDRKILNEIAVNNGFYGKKAKEKLRKLYK